MEDLVAKVLNRVLHVNGQPQVTNPNWNRGGTARVTMALETMGRNGKDLVDLRMLSNSEMKYVLYTEDTPFMSLPFTGGHGGSEKNVSSQRGHGFYC